MIRVLIIVLILGLTLGGSSCGRSAEKTKADYSTEKSEKELNPMEREVIEEESEVLGEEMGGLETPGDDWGDDDEYPEI